MTNYTQDELYEIFNSAVLDTESENFNAVAVTRDIAPYVAGRCVRVRTILELEINILELVDQNTNGFPAYEYILISDALCEQLGELEYDHYKNAEYTDYLLDVAYNLTMGFEV